MTVRSHNTKSKEATLPKVRVRIRKSDDVKRSTDCEVRLCSIWKWVRRSLNNVFMPFGQITDVGFFTAILALVAYLQWMTLNNTDETLKAQQRAWIQPGPPIVVGSIKENLPINLLIRYRNIGHEPATDAVIALDEPSLLVVANIGNWYERLPGRNPVCGRTTPNSAGIVIYPSPGSNEFQAHIFPNQRVPDMAMVLAETKTLVIEGCIGYRTIGKAHYAGFCYYWTAIPGKPPEQWGVTQCQTRNEAF